MKSTIKFSYSNINKNIYETIAYSTILLSQKNLKISPKAFPFYHKKKKKKTLKQKFPIYLLINVINFFRNLVKKVWGAYCFGRFGENCLPSPTLPMGSEGWINRPAFLNLKDAWDPPTRLLRSCGPRPLKSFHSLQFWFFSCWPPAHVFLESANSARVGPTGRPKPPFWAASIYMGSSPVPMMGLNIANYVLLGSHNESRNRTGMKFTNKSMHQNESHFEF